MGQRDEKQKLKIEFPKTCTRKVLQTIAFEMLSMPRF